jgi:hypothetical protein
VAVATIVDKRSLQRRFDPRYFCQIYVASQLSLGLTFKIKFFDLVSVYNHDAGFFRVRGIDKHFLCHFVRSHDDQAAERCRSRGKSWFYQGQ